MFDVSKFGLRQRQRFALRGGRSPRAVSRLARVLALVLGAVTLTGCGSTGAALDAHPLRIYATTGYLADAVANLAPEAEVTTMVGPGGDPHSYQPSTRDIERILDADLVVWNGLHLEAQMMDQLASLGDRQFAVGETLPPERLIELPATDAAGEPLIDPHVWNDPELWALVVANLAQKLAEIDPEGAAAYATRAEEYTVEIERAAALASTQLQSVPQPRMIITGHDAFAYFGRAFDLEVRATDFMSTQAALSAAELHDLASVITQHRVPVIFRDNQANPQAITSLREAVRAQGWEVEVSGAELYADALGAEPGVDTYLGVFAHNSAAIAAALGEEQP